MVQTQFSDHDLLAENPQHHGTEDPTYQMLEDRKKKLFRKKERRLASLGAAVARVVAVRMRDWPVSGFDRKDAGNHRLKHSSGMWLGMTADGRLNHQPRQDQIS